MEAAPQSPRLDPQHLSSEGVSTERALMADITNKKNKTTKKSMNRSINNSNSIDESNDYTVGFEIFWGGSSSQVVA